jgi:hypothetical protein
LIYFRIIYTTFNPDSSLPDVKTLVMPLYLISINRYKSYPPMQGLVPPAYVANANSPSVSQVHKYYLYEVMSIPGWLNWMREIMMPLFWQQPD